MTLQEFKAWFEGYTESLNGPPGEKQWKRICDRVKQIDGTVTSYPVFVERYYPRPTFLWNGYPTNMGVGYVDNTVDPNAGIPVNFASLGSMDAAVDAVN